MAEGLLRMCVYFWWRGSRIVNRGSDDDDDNGDHDLGSSFVYLGITKEHEKGKKHKKLDIA